MKMSPINRCNTEHWKEDVRKSVLFYNNWFLNFAPITYVNARKQAIERVERAFNNSNFFNDITEEMLMKSPETVAILRMATTPPLARDRLAGLANVPKQLIKKLEEGKSSGGKIVIADIVGIIVRLLDREMMPWLKSGETPTALDATVASAIIGDRVCGALADPIIRNEQERRQIRSIEVFLLERGYRLVQSKDYPNCTSMPPGTFAYHMNVPARVGRRRNVNVSVDVAIMCRNDKPGDMPLLVECKSAGDFTNVNKRRKEEAAKMEQLKKTYGNDVRYVLFLCGYFDSGYLGYEAADGIDWVWEHRIDDLGKVCV